MANWFGDLNERVAKGLNDPDAIADPEEPKQLTLWKMLRKHGVGLYTAQMICNDVMLNGVTLPSSPLSSNTRETGLVDK